MPAEWEPRSGTLLSWPQNRETWPGERLHRVEKNYIEIIRHIVAAERLFLITGSEDTRIRAGRLLSTIDIDMDRITFIETESNDVWARDFGPVFVRNEKSKSWALTDWEYNAWGEKYPPWDADNKIPKLFSKRYGLKRFSTGMVLEGGSIETNGKGVMLTTESVLLNKNRNPGLTKAQIEQKLKEYLGQEKIIWLRKGLAGDDTDGHIDDLSRFINPNTIVTMLTDDKSDVNYDALYENYELLKSAVDQHGNPFEVIPLPMPSTRIEGTTVDGSEHVPASYANFYFINGGLLLPVYDERYDDEVIRVFRKLLPDRRIIPVRCADLVWGQGSIHCITQQLYGVPGLDDGA